MYDLDELKEICNNCYKCELCKKRHNVVFGEGNKNADIMFIAEGPGRNEDLMGRPFVGKAGQLLDKMLESIDLKREDIYIANIVKCRPDNNRNPNNNEIKSCLPYLRWQVKIINPKIIYLLGSVASKVIIRDDFRITKERGNIIKKGNLYIIPSYHPAALLRDESKKRPAFMDLKKLRNLYDELNRGD